MPQLILLQTRGPEASALAETASQSGFTAVPCESLPVSPAAGETVFGLGSDAPQPLTALRQLAANHPAAAPMNLQAGTSGYVLKQSKSEKHLVHLW